LVVDQQAFREAMREIGSRGGQARAKSLTAKERSRIAQKASKAAAAARTKKAKDRKAANRNK
jgi:hypothetical protein